VATALRIPIAHIEGGEVSRGAIDDTIRNALTKLSHLHLVPHKSAEARVLAMGEESWRIHRTGTPSLDHLVKSRLLERDELERKLGCTIAPDATLVVLHPVTMLADTLQESDAVFWALGKIDRPLLFCFPNADAGSRRLIELSQQFVSNRKDREIFVNLNPVDYWSLLGQVDVMLGNSSSGIMETPSLALPTVNIGRRQEGRERALNVIDCIAEVDPILQAHHKACSADFRTSLEGMSNPYGDGRAAEKIVDVLLGAPFGARLLEKEPVQFQLRDGDNSTL
jgi:UDP-N-acetylglucosamine 2-epimerase (non-hydrolysing)/GDP/UDP-N,N'-diacetylbacillosamine 2-epimerase (hydrolysing)